MLQVKNLSISFISNEATTKVVHDVNFELKKNEILGIVGESGSGKSVSTLAILGLLSKKNAVLEGEILFENNNIINFTEAQFRAIRGNIISMIFQEPMTSLNPSLTCGYQVLEILQLHNSIPPKEAKAEVLRLFEKVKLPRVETIFSQYPHQLSGGQCQRVALARAMAPKPKLILLDEPFSSVETGLQSALVHEVKTMLQADHSTALWVTHSLDEAFAVADHMGVMLNGKLLQWSTPTELYNKPANAEVVQFLNHANLVDGTIIDGQKINTSMGIYNLSDTINLATGSIVQIVINKQDVTINDGGKVNAIVNNVVYQGGQYLVTALLENNSSIQFHHHAPIDLKHSISLKITQTEPFHGFELS